MGGIESVLGGVEIVMVPGDHDTVLLGVNAELLVKPLNRAIDRAVQAWKAGQTQESRAGETAHCRAGARAVDCELTDASAAARPRGPARRLDAAAVLALTAASACRTPASSSPATGATTSSNKTCEFPGERLGLHIGMVGILPAPVHVATPFPSGGRP